MKAIRGLHQPKAQLLMLNFGHDTLSGAYTRPHISKNPLSSNKE